MHWKESNFGKKFENIWGLISAFETKTTFKKPTKFNYDYSKKQPKSENANLIQSYKSSRSLYYILILSPEPRGKQWEDHHL